MRRLTVLVRLKTANNWTKPYEAIVDTGAPLSIIPAQIWEGIETKDLGTGEIGGIVPDAKLKVRTAEVTVSLMDRVHTSAPFHFKAFLSEERRVPLILGFDGVLSKSILHVDSLQQQGYLEFQ